MAFCTKCGTSVPEGIKFCTECGKPMEETAQPVPAMATAPASPPVAPAQSVAQPSPLPQQQAFAPAIAQPVQIHPTRLDDAPPKGSPYAVMSTGSYILMSILFALPLVGWLACIIMSFAAKNLNRRNFAKATLIFIVIGLVLSVILYFVLGRVWQSTMESAQEYAGDAAGGNPGLGDLLGALK